MLGWTTKQRKKTEQPNCCLHRHVQPLICTSVGLFTAPAACARLSPRSSRGVSVRSSALSASRSPRFPSRSAAALVRGEPSCLSALQRHVANERSTHKNTRVAAHVRAHRQTLGWLVAGVPRKLSVTLNTPLSLLFLFELDSPSKARTQMSAKAPRALRYNFPAAVLSGVMDSWSYRFVCLQKQDEVWGTVWLSGYLLRLLMRCPK